MDKLDELVQKFPTIADKLFAELDNVALANCKVASRPLCDFISEGRTELIRKIQGYVHLMNEHYDDWNKVLRKAPISILKEIVSAIEKRQSLRDRQLWKFTSDNKLVNKNGPWKYSDITWNRRNARNNPLTLSQMDRTPKFLQDVETNQVLCVVGKEVVLKAKDENSHPDLNYKTSRDDPFSDMERAFAEKGTKLSIATTNYPDIDWIFAEEAKTNPKKRRQLWRMKKIYLNSGRTEGWFEITTTMFCCHKKLTAKDASTVTLVVEFDEIVTRDEFSPHQVATCLGHSKLYQYFAEKLGKSNPMVFNGIGGRNFTAFHTAAQMGHTDICRYIIQNTIEKNPASDENQWPPLHLAIMGGHLETCKLIMENADDKNPLNSFGQTALQRAMWANLFGINEDMYYCMETTLMSLGIKYHPNFDLNDDHKRLRLKHQRDCKFCTPKKENSDEASASSSQ